MIRAINKVLIDKCSRLLFNLPVALHTGRAGCAGNSFLSTGDQIMIAKPFQWVPTMQSYNHYNIGGDVT